MTHVPQSATIGSCPRNPRFNSHGQPLLRSGKLQRTIYPSPPEPDRSQFVRKMKVP